MRGISVLPRRMLLLSALLGFVLAAPALAQTVPMDSAFLSSATYLPAFGTDVYVVNGGTTLLAVQNVTLNDPVTTLPNGALSIDASTYTVTFASGSDIFNGSAPVTIESSSPGNGLVLMNGGIAAGTLTIDQTTLEMGNGSALAVSGSVVDNGTLIFDRTSVPAALDIIGSLSGTGSLQLVALASAPLQIIDASGFTGTTTIGSGTTLEITTPMSANITNNGTLIFVGATGSPPVTYGYAISGTGAVGTGGYVTFTGNQTYTGGTNVSGTLQLGTGGTTGAIVGNVDDEGTLAFDRSDTYTFAGNISGGGGIAVLGTGTIILTGNNTFNASNVFNGIATPNRILAGTLQIGNGGTTGSIAGPIVNNSVLAFDLSNTFVYGDAISGTGETIQMGTGTLVLNGTNTATGETLVSSGTLVVGDVAHPGASLNSTTGGVYVQHGATLEGYGTIVGAVNNSGTVMPGDGPGTLTVGSFAQTSSGTLAINVAQGDVGLLRVLGPASLAGTLDVNFGGTATPGEYTFLTANSITGQFGNIVVGGTARDGVAVQYAPTSASLIIVPASSAQFGGAFVRNTLDVAENLDDAIFAHLADQNCREPGALVSNNLPNCPELSVWHRIFGGAGAIDGTNDLSAVSSRWAGFTGGIDVHADQGFWLGLSGTYERNELGLAGDDGQIGTNVFSMALTGGLPVFSGRVDAMASFHMNDGDSKRIVSINGSTANAEANPKDSLWSVAVQYEHDFLVDCLSGFTRFTYANLNQDSYSEAGAAPFDLQIDSKTFSTGYADLGLHYNDTFVLHSGTQIIPEALAGVRAILGSTEPDLQAQIANAATASTIDVPELDRRRVAFKANVGVTAQNDSLSYYLRLDGLINGNQREGAIMIGAVSSF